MISPPLEPVASPSRRRRAARAAVAVLAAAISALASADAAARPEQGERVTVTGRVSSAGRPVPALLVRLEGSRSKVSLRRLGRVKGHQAQVATTTDAAGEYTVDWEWHDFYNRFDLVLLVRTAKAEGPVLQELERIDVTQRMALSGPIVVGVELQSSPELERHLEFADALTSAAERDTFQEMGPPDRVDRLALPGREEVTWWYFRTGTAYRFEDGRLDEVVRFEPVESF